jgi:glyoxylase-like metal-dependent hydrolase (beta-lactamase superfamily II)
LQENAYVLGNSGSGKALVVDPGDEAERIHDEVGRRGWSIEWVVLTHGHADHIGGAGPLIRLSGAGLAAAAGDAPMLKDPMLCGAAWLGYPFEALDPGVLLRDGEAWNAVGRTWQVLETPGHTPGHICLYSELDGLLVCGDVLFSGSVGRTDLPGGSWEALARSLREKVFVLPDSTRVLPGHGPETTLGEERETNPYVREALSGAGDPWGPVGF